ncbi:MAG: cell division/cell wall cluster transcriptional repressor MraZ [Candidatus Gottesmanbacteria bacterium]
MFLGTYKTKLIGKNRVAMPAKIRDEIGGDRVVLTIGLEECIFGFREKDWEEVVKPELTRPFFTDSGSRDLRRKMSYNAQVIDLASLGRFVMPEMMVEYAGIKDEEVTIIGAADHFEIWESKKWEEYSKNLK